MIRFAHTTVQHLFLASACLFFDLALAHCLHCVMKSIRYKHILQTGVSDVRVSLRDVICAQLNETVVHG